MAAPFVVLAWAPGLEATHQAGRLAEALSAAGRWRLAFRQARMEVWVPEGDAPPVSAPADGAVVIGQIHAQGGVSAFRPATLGGSSDAVARARDLAGRGWGRYVAVFADAAGAWRWAFRDPSGALDVLTWRRGDVTVLASDVEDLPGALLPARRALDWDGLARVVRSAVAVGGEDVLHGLETVAPGDLKPLGGGAATPIWRPAWIARGPAPGDPAEVLRCAVDAAVAAELTGGGRCLVEVSGGLDSAIVATTAARVALAGDIVGALHLQGARRESDERPWAEAVAQAVGWRLELLPLEARRFGEEDLMALARGVRPIVNAPDVGRDAATAERLAALGVRTLLTGKGGDVVFFQHPTAQILSDQLATHGWGALAGPLPLALARRLRRSVWSVGWEAVRALRRPGSAGPAPSPLLGARARAAPARPEHPWLEDLEGLPPAKRFQVLGLAASQTLRGRTRYRRVAEVVHPLLAQPVMEAALAIPAFELAREGRERGLARDAFADRLPEVVRTRRAKGELAGHFARLVILNLDVLKPWLLDGSLCRAELLDRPRLEAALTPEAILRDGDTPFILRMAAIEAFVRHWQGRVPDWPAAARRVG